MHSWGIQARILLYRQISKIADGSKFHRKLEILFHQTNLLRSAQYFAINKYLCSHEFSLESLLYIRLSQEDGNMSPRCGEDRSHNHSFLTHSFLQPQSTDIFCHRLVYYLRNLGVIILNTTLHHSISLDRFDNFFVNNRTYTQETQDFEL